MVTVPDVNVYPEGVSQASPSGYGRGPLRRGGRLEWWLLKTLRQAATEY